MNFMFGWQNSLSCSPREHKIHISKPTCNVLFIIWRPVVVENAEFYFIVFEKLSKFYISYISFEKLSKFYISLAE